MLYICIPAYDEASTVGLVLWRIRKVMQDFPREYEIAVYDDASTDATAETLRPYADVLPLTVIAGTPHRGYAHAVDALADWVVRRTRYARRDAAIMMQADFTDAPEAIPELVKRFEGGADVVVGQSRSAAFPTPMRRARGVARWVFGRFAPVPGVTDPFSSLRLFRISVLRDARRRQGSAPLVSGSGWVTNAELLLRTAAAARRIETIDYTPRYDLRTRETRARPVSEALAVLRFARPAWTMARALARGGSAAITAGASEPPETAVDLEPTAPASVSRTATRHGERRAERTPGRPATRPAPDRSAPRRGRSTRPASTEPSATSPTPASAARATPESTPGAARSGAPRSRAPRTGAPRSASPRAPGSPPSGTSPVGSIPLGAGPVGSIPPARVRPVEDPDGASVPTGEPRPPRSRGRNRGRGRGRNRPQSGSSTPEPGTTSMDQSAPAPGATPGCAPTPTEAP